MGCSSPWNEPDEPVDLELHKFNEKLNKRLARLRRLKSDSFTVDELLILMNHQSVRLETQRFATKYLDKEITKMEVKNKRKLAKIRIKV